MKVMPITTTGLKSEKVRLPSRDVKCLQTKKTPQLLELFQMYNIVLEGPSHVVCFICLIHNCFFIMAKHQMKQEEYQGKSCVKDSCRYWHYSHLESFVGIPSAISAMVIAPPDLQRHPGKSHCLITFSNSAVVWRIFSEMFLQQVR